MPQSDTADLVIQHPTLDEAIVAALTVELGASPRKREPARARWCDLVLTPQAAESIAQKYQIDVALVPRDRVLADFRLVAFDMDSTLISVECVDEIADFAGRKAEVAAITAAAMRGEIDDYDASLRDRVALLAGLDAQVLERVWNERVRLTSGARTLVVGLHASGLRSLLVSGGFTFFTERLQALLGLDFTCANTLEIRDGRLTGQLVGEIVNAQGKQRALETTCAQIGCAPSQAIAVGDGANDLAMMAVAGLSVAYRAKPAVAAQATHAIEHCGLDAILGFFSPIR